MKPLNISDLSMSQVTAFYSVAETGSMTRSAEKLHISQPAISKRINMLERQTGLILFRREKNNLIITPAGKQLYADLKEIHAMMSSSFIRAYDLQEAKKERFVIGIDPYFDLEILWQVIEEFQRKHSHIEVDFFTCPSSEQITKLLAGELNIAFAYTELVGLHENLEYLHVINWQYYAMINKNNPLAKKGLLSIEDIMNCPVVSLGSAYIDLMEQLWIKKGKKLYVSQVTGGTPAYYYLLLDRGIFIANPTFLNEFGHRDFLLSRVKLYKLDDMYMDIGFCWNKTRENQYVKSFLSAYERVLARDGNAEKLEKAFNGDFSD